MLTNFIHQHFTAILLISLFLVIFLLGVILYETYGSPRRKTDRRLSSVYFWLEAIKIIPTNYLVQLFAPEGLRLEVRDNQYDLIKIVAYEGETVTSINDLHIYLQGDAIKNWEQVFYVKEAIEQGLITSEKVESLIKTAILRYVARGKWDNDNSNTPKLVRYSW